MPNMYQAYAPIYQHIGQGAWSERMAAWTLDWLGQHGIKAESVVDWGCGDGAAAVLFARSGWYVRGIDHSPAMLELARQRATAAHLPITFQLGDLRVTEVDQPALLATAFYDTLNYLTTADDLAAGWRMIARSIKPGGYAVVDVNTAYEYASAWTGQYAVTADSDDVLVVNRLRYNARSGIARGRVIWFARKADSDQWVRGAETHVQRAHTDVEMVSAIEQAGLSLLERHTPDGSEPSATATRLIYVAYKAPVVPR